MKYVKNCQCKSILIQKLTQIISPSFLFKKKKKKNKQIQLKRCYIQD